MIIAFLCSSLASCGCPGLTYLCALRTLLPPRVVRNGFYSVSRSWRKVKATSCSESQHKVLRTIQGDPPALARFAHSRAVAGPRRYGPSPRAPWRSPGRARLCPTDFLPLETSSFPVFLLFSKVGVSGTWEEKIKLQSPPTLRDLYTDPPFRRAWGANPQLANLFGTLMPFRTFWFCFVGRSCTPDICSRGKTHSVRGVI